MGCVVDFGFKLVMVDFDFVDVMDWVQQKIEIIVFYDFIECYIQFGVECIIGYVKLILLWEVEVNGQILSVCSIVIVIGVWLVLLFILGLVNIGFVIFDIVWDLCVKLKSIVIMGGGLIGCEFSQVFLWFGVEVMQIEMLLCLLMCEDEEVFVLVL